MSIEPLPSSSPVSAADDEKIKSLPNHLLILGLSNASFDCAAWDKNTATEPYETMRARVTQYADELTRRLSALSTATTRAERAEEDAARWRAVDELDRRALLGDMVRLAMRYDTPISVAVDAALARDPELAARSASA